MLARPKHLGDFLHILDAVLRNQNGSQNQSPRCSLFLIIIDNLSMLTIGFGHKRTEEIVADLSAEIQRKLKGTIGVFCIQSDQIALILEQVDPPELIRAEIEIKNIIRMFGVSKGQNLHISAKVGYQLLNKQDKPAEAYLSELYQRVFSHCAGSSFYDDFAEVAQNNGSLQEMVMANQISEALAGNKLRLAYQPIVCARTGEVEHYEALLRLLNDDGELESAGSLIPIAERMGFISAIDILTLDMALEKLQQNPALSIALNISHVTIGNREWLKKFFELVTGEIAPRLIIEITETVANQNLRETAYFIATLQEAGCRVALDDFGSGYTSYKQIQALALDMIKIDGSLIEGIEKNKHNQILVRALVEYFKEYGLKIIAEHVDSGATAKMLQEFDIDLLQGYYFGEAVTNV